MSTPVIDVQDLHFGYSGNEVLRGVSFSVPPGCVCGLVGENGAGKTTLIKHLLGRLTPQSGSVSVFGWNPTIQPADVLGQTGYLSENRDLPNWMTSGEFIDYIRVFYPNWDDVYAEQLRNQFELARHSKVSSLSRGQRARLGLIAALSHRPPLLLLDEPSSGLDAVVRSDILNAVIRVVGDEGRTVLFSSHLLGELQQVSDRIIMIDRGQTQIDSSIDELLNSHVQILAHIPSPLTLGDHPAILTQRTLGDEWEIILRVPYADEVTEMIKDRGGEIRRRSRPSLEKLFVAHAAGPQNHGQDEVSQ